MASIFFSNLHYLLPGLRAALLFIAFSGLFFSTSLGLLFYWLVLRSPILSEPAAGASRPADYSTSH